MVRLVILVMLFVSLSGLMALVEAAVLSVTSAEVESMAARGTRGAVTLRRIKRRITDAVVVLVVLTNTINVLGPVLVGTTAVDLYGSQAIGFVTAAVTLLTIVFSEVIPKSLGTHYAPRLSVLAATPLRVLIICFYPLVWVFGRLTSAMRVGERRIGTEEQIRSLARLGHSAGYIETDETQLVHRAFQLNDRQAAEIMTPIDRVVGLQPNMTASDAARVVGEASFSRYPVIDTDQTVRGVLISHDLLVALTTDKADVPVTRIARAPFTVPHSMPADDLLAAFRKRRFHLAVVTREGHTVGIVTLEDVLEELVGEIEDEKE
jgi:putative hemolysin